MSMRKLSIQVNGRLVSTATNYEEDEPDDELFEHTDEQDFAMRTTDRVCSSVAFFLYPFLLIAQLSASCRNTITNSTGTGYPCLDLCNEGLIL